MSSGLSSTLRRIILLGLAAAAGAAAFAWWRDRRPAGTVMPPEWPPFEPKIVPPLDTAPVVWSGPTDDGVAPAGFPIKAKVSSGIFHEPGGRFYDRTIADRYYQSAGAAEADGYRRSKR